MASLKDRTDAARAAVSSISTCSAATTVLLRDLILADNATCVPESRPTKTTGRSTTKPASKSASARARSNKTATEAGSTREQLSSKEKAVLATHVINTVLKSLGDAAKTPTAPTLSQQPVPTPQPGELVKRAPRNALRRSISAPATPLRPRALNRVSTSPITVEKPTRPFTSASNSTSCLSMVECARVALVALRALRDSREISLPELQLETGMSQLISKLIALNMLDQATKELRLLKQQLCTLAGPATAAATATAKKASKESSQHAEVSSATRFPDLLDFRAAKVSGKVILLVVSTQLHALRILSMTKKPQQTELVVDLLKGSNKTSPLNLLLAYAESNSANHAKAARQMETLSQLLLSLTPSVSSKSDEEAVERRLSISPSAALDLQVLGLEARTQWWAFAGHKGDVDKDIMLPLSRCLSAYVRRNGSVDQDSFQNCIEAFHRLSDLVARKGMKPSNAFKSPTASIYRTLAAIARESRDFEEAVRWTEILKAMLAPADDSEAVRCSIAALLLSLHLKTPSRHMKDETLLREVIDGIQGALKGDSAELEELLGNIGFARRSAINILTALSSGKSSPAEAEQQVPVEVRDLLESLVLQCPRFCLRWLGKPPASNGSTKDFLRYEQRRQLLVKSLHHFLDSGFIVIKILIDEERISWPLMDSVLNDSLTLLDYMGDLGGSESASSHHVKISHFYFVQHTLLRQTAKDPQDAEPLRALRRSIECVKHRPSKEQEKSQVIMKLERMAEMCVSMGRTTEALGALQSIRSSLVDDGVLDEVVQELRGQPPTHAWSCSSRASILSRTLVSISKMEQVSIDWTVGFSEEQQLAVLEHRLHLVLLGQSKEGKRPSLADKCVESLLKTYYPTRYPIRRLRTLLGLLTVNVEDPNQYRDIQLQVEVVLGLLDTKDLGEDSTLEGYLSHYRAYYASIIGLKTASGSGDLGEMERSISEWRGTVEGCTTAAELERRIDNPAALLTHLQSVADFARTMGHDSIQLAALELLASMSKVSSASSPDDKVGSESGLALLYVNIGQSLKAERVLDSCHRHVVEAARPVSGEAVAELHLAYAELYVLTGKLDKADIHFKQAQSVATSGGSGVRWMNPRKKEIITYAGLLQSMIASKKGEAHHALVAARGTARILLKTWSKLEKLIASPPSNNPSEAPSGPADDTSDSIEAGSQALATAPSRLAGPEFWRLFHPLFRTMSHLSSLYAHLGMYQETVYYAEQAQKIALSTNARLYLAQAETWLGSVYLKAGKLEKSLEMANLSSSRLREGDRTCLSVTLACQLGDLYRDLDEFDPGLEMIGRAEAAMRLLAKEHSRTSEGSPSAPVGDSAGETAADLNRSMAKLSIKEKPTTRKGVATVKKAAAPAAAARRTTRKASARAEAAVVAPATTKPHSHDHGGLHPHHPVVDDVVLSALRASVILHKAVSLLNRRDWAGAMEVLQESRAMPKLGRSSLVEMVARSSCLFGQSQEQMTRHAVFSVIQDSTLSFPAVCAAGSAAGAASPDKIVAACDRLSLTKVSPQKKGRAGAGSGIGGGGGAASAGGAAFAGGAASAAVAATTAVAGRERPKEGGGGRRQLLDFLENLQAAHDCLAEAHSVAIVSGDGAMVHRIAGMLQSAVLLLSAACPSKPARALGQQQQHQQHQQQVFAACSVEAAQNLTWLREREALLVEKKAALPRMDGASVVDGLDWLGSLAGGGSPTAPASTPAAIAAADNSMARFQRDYIDIIPSDWAVVSISLSDNKHDLCISRLQAGHSPFVIRLPLERAVSRDAAAPATGSNGGCEAAGGGGDGGSFSFGRGRAELLEIVRLANESCHTSKRDLSSRGSREAWWAERAALDRRMRELLVAVEQVWLGGFRGVLSQREQRRPELLARFQRSFHDILDRHLPSRRQVRGRRARSAAAASSSSSSSSAAASSTSAAGRITLDPRILELFVALGDPSPPSLSCPSGGGGGGEEEDEGEQQEEGEEDDDDDAGAAAADDLDDALNDLLYFVVDILQFHGERNAYDEIDFDSMCVETLDALHAYHAAVRQQKQQERRRRTHGEDGAEDEDDRMHTILVLDKALHAFPWESLPCMRKVSASRVPSLACLRRLILQRGHRGVSSASSSSTAASESRSNSSSSSDNNTTSGRHYVSRSSGAYILNPEGDLKTTLATFESPLSSALPDTWSRTVSRPPSERELESHLVGRDVLLYFGHGSGAQYIRSRTIRRLICDDDDGGEEEEEVVVSGSGTTEQHQQPADQEGGGSGGGGGCRATVFLMGCSSASLVECGEFEVHGPVWNYLMAGCPAVVGTLWDVTDRDIDRFAGRAFEEWGLVEAGTFGGAGEKKGAATAAAVTSGKGKGQGKGRPKAPATPAAAVAADGGGYSAYCPPGKRRQQSLVQAVARARDVCRFRYMTAAAVCVYGIPVYVCE